MRARRTRSSCLIGVSRAIAVAVCLLLAPVGVDAGFWESFEGPLPSWRIVDGDASHKITRHQRVDSPVHSGAWSESITVEASGGSYLHAALDVPPVALIDELELGIWVRSDRPGIQLLARVVLPRSIDPVTQKPVTLLLHGSVSQLAGRWERLHLREIRTAMARQVRIARSDNVSRATDKRLAFDIREAYIDQVRLNIYGGSGSTTIWIDDLAINGYVEVDLPLNTVARDHPSNAVQRDGEVNSPGPSQREREDRSLRVASHWQPGAASESSLSQGGEHRRRHSQIAPVAWESTMLASAGKPLLPRIVEYRGEPLAHLRSLGFNAAWLENPPSLALLEEASTAGMWLVCPAPAIGTPPFKNPIEPILCWHVGRELSRRDLRITADRVTHLRRVDTTARRPVCAQVVSNIEAFSRHVDLLLLDRKVIGTSLDMEDYFHWLSASRQLARPGAAFWAKLYDRAPDDYIEQAKALGLEESSPHVADWQSLRRMALGAVAHGVRGLVFASDSRLDGDDPLTRQRAAQYELLNLELSLIEPWAAAGRFSTTVESNDESVKAYVLQSDHTRLVLPLRSETTAGKHVQRDVGGRTPSRSLRFVVPGVPDVNRAYELSVGGLRPLTSVRIAGGKSVTLDSGAVGTLIVLTSDPRVTGELNRRIAKIRKRAAELTHLLAAELTRDTDATLRASARIPAAAVQPPVSEASRSLQQSRTALDGGDHHGSIRAAHAAIGAVEIARQAALPHFGILQHQDTTFSVPLDQRFNMLPASAATGSRLARASWSVNRLSGGDCENLRQMVQAGWRNVEFPQQGLATDVQLSSHFPVAGRTSLHLRAAPVAGASSPRLVESPPVWIETAAVPVRAGEIVQIQGAVRVTRPIRGGVDKLLVFDSLGGKDLGLRFGAADSWQRFVIYRAAAQTGNVSVTFALSGVGEAWIDEVTIQTAATLPPTSTGPGSSTGPALPSRPIHPADSQGPRFPPNAGRPLATQPSVQSVPAAGSGPVDPFAGVPLQ